MPYNTVATNQAMTSTFLNTNYRDQVVSTVTSSTRPTGTEGQVIYETDTDKVLIYDGSSWVEYGRLSAYGGWTTTVTQSGTVTHTINRADYVRIGRMVHAHGQLSITGSGTGNNSISVSLPVTAADSAGVIGTAIVQDTGTASYYCIATFSSTTAMAFRRADTTPSSNVGVDPNFALANTDVIYFNVMYEAA